VVTPTFEYQSLNIQLFMTLTSEKDHVSLAASSRNQQCSCSGQKISIIDQLAPAIVLNAQWLSLKSQDVSEDFGRIGNNQQTFATLRNSF
jgi:hypothetical protein